VKSLLLALDAGTSGCKAEVFTPEGRSVSQGSSGYGSGMTGSSGTELEPSRLRSAVAAAVREALAGSDAGDIGGVGVSAQLGLATIDSKGRPVGNLVTWADPRGAEQARRIAEVLGEAQVYQTCGRRVSPEWILPRLLHLRENDPSSWAQGTTHLSIKDFLVHELTGRRLTDPTHASYTLAYDVTQRQWSKAILESVDVPAETLPEVVPAHQIAGETGGTLAREMGLPDGVPVVVGGPDGTMGALGAGLVDEGRAVGVVGTTDVFFACSRTPVFDPLQGTVVNCYAVPDLWALGGPMSSTGGCLQWFATHFAHREAAEAARKNVSLYAYLDELAEAVPPGSDGLLCLPSLVGERAPSWEPDRRGAFSGLSPRHGVAHMARAILEGTAFASRVMVERLESMGVTPQEVVLAGGGARSRLWCQIRADVLDTPVRIPEVVDATNLGTALLAAVALGHHPDCGAAAREMVTLAHRLEPDPTHKERYRALYEAYLEVHDALGPATARLSEARLARRDAAAATRIIPESGESKT
jgi:sugar (pentulose or hexulose) kinase